MGTRLKLVGVVFGLASLALIGKLFFWQVVKSAELSNQARYQQQSGERVLAHRGNILASDGTWLVATSQAWTVFVSKPDMMEDTKTVANKLAPLILEYDEEDEGSYRDHLLTETLRIEGLLNKKEVVWIPVKRKVSGDVKKNIESLKIKGVGFEPEEARSYPEASSAAQVLGFVGKDEGGSDKGYFGLEGFYDLLLTGKPGFISRQKDAQGSPIMGGDSKEISAVGGVDIKTHIDKTVQMLVEEKLKEGIEKYGAKDGRVIIVNPKDGAVIAMASYPAYDPAKYAQFSNEVFKNPNISDAFEPGSIFKPLIMAAGLDADVIEPDTKCDICDGPVKVDVYEIETWDKKYHPDSTMTEVLVHSDNVGMTFVGNKLGKEKLYDYLHAFGLGEPTGIDLQGEANPGLRKKDKWNVVDTATATFGQGVAVTPIQMIKAFSAIANGGKVVTPQVVDKITKDGWEEDIKPEIGEAVISQEAAKKATAMMVEAVKSGEAKWAVPKGFKVAGKTGTAQIAVKGHYDEDKTIASFIGFAPADNPRFLMLVSLREPSTSQWGSETAAPLWFNIARELFPYLGIQPQD